MAKRESKHQQDGTRTRDLFGDVAITREDCATWLRIVARMDPDTKRADRYSREWDVVGKVRAAKLRGDFPPTGHS